MFTEDTLSFLRDLAVNNDREWFAANKGRYEASLKVPAAAFIDSMSAALAEDTGVAFRGKLFRIHRDLRFSKDKTPYNPHVHISFAAAEPVGLAPAFMLGLAPEYFTLGCGTFAFSKIGLESFRDAVAGPAGKEIAVLLSNLAHDGVRIEPPVLKRVPAPFERDHPRADLLRHKGLVGWLDARPDEGIGPKGADRARTGFARLKPLFNFLRSL